MFISWIDSHGRSADLARSLNMQAVFISGRGNRRNAALIRYWRAFRRTRRELRTLNPNVVMVMLPPAPALLSILISRRRGTQVVADLHTGFFKNPKWSWFVRPALWLLRNSAVLVTNSHLGEICENARVRTFVVHDSLTVNNGPCDDQEYVLCPLSYAKDEPVLELLDAARALNKMKFVFTGKPPIKYRNVAPQNVEFVGYVTNEKFDSLLRGSTMVVALTKRDHTMQRAGYEALMACKPQVTSSFSVLQEFLDDSAAYADPASHDDIANKIMNVAASRQTYANNAKAVLGSRITDQERVIGDLSAYVRQVSNSRR